MPSSHPIFGSVSMTSRPCAISSAPCGTRSIISWISPPRLDWRCPPFRKGSSTILPLGSRTCSYTSTLSLPGREPCARTIRSGGTSSRITGESRPLHISDPISLSLTHPAGRAISCNATLYLELCLRSNAPCRGMLPKNDREREEVRFFFFQERN